MKLSLRSARVLLAGSMALTGCSSSRDAPSKSDAGNETADAPIPTVTTAIPLTPLMGGEFTGDASAGTDGGTTVVGYTGQVTLEGTETFSLLVDTGSPSVVVAASSCTGCVGASPLYSPGNASTDLHETGMISYGAGSAQGELYTDTAQLGSAPAVPVTVLAITSATGMFGFGPSFQGLLGLNTASDILMKGELDYFPQLVAQKGVADVFAVGLCPDAGSLWFGGYDPSAMTASPTFVPVLPEDGDFLVNMSEIDVAGKSLPVSASAYGPAIPDTGTAVIGLGGELFTAAATAIASDAEFQKLFGGAEWFEGTVTCKTVPQTAAELDALLPTFTVKLGSTSLQATATTSYLLQSPTSSGTRWCPGLISLGAACFGDGKSSENFGPDAGCPADTWLNILGDTLLRSQVVIFDEANQRIGFAPHDCP